MNILLATHILFGTFALLSAAVATISAKGEKLHRFSGSVYFWSMTAIFVTAIPMSLITHNIFLFLIAVFSFYLAFAGMRFAKNRTGLPTLFDWLAVGLMIASGIGMLLLSLVYYFSENTQYIVLLVFGFLAILLGYSDYKSHRDRTAVGKQRIAKHLTSMLGGTIAVVTAVLVVNIEASPTWLWWVLPTFVITPMIAYWNRKVIS